MKEKKPVVVRVTKTEFELDDGRVFPHPVELDEVPTIEDFQKIYDKSRKLVKDMMEDAGEQSD
ncbi:MAG: hypothetical protein GF334_08550 [Candidatus Altiarchaeales archaeon]|nr:hypothetical protein [Candidatus Altiarchaeales archaeon]